MATLAKEPLAQTLPQYSKQVHLGVASCATSFCHGSASKRSENNVFQNEYHTWLKGGDKHSGAYRLLLDKPAKRIARNALGGFIEQQTIGTRVFVAALEPSVVLVLKNVVLAPFARRAVAEARCA